MTFLGISKLPRGDYQTLAGFLITHAGRIPSIAEAFEWEGYRYSVVEMDGLRVNKIQVSPCQKS